MRLPALGSNRMQQPGWICSCLSRSSSSSQTFSALLSAGMVSKVASGGVDKRYHPRVLQLQQPPILFHLAHVRPPMGQVPGASRARGQPLARSRGVACRATSGAAIAQARY